jgi:peptidoglycan/xylan/chitin deacetylase (PgdA/CDA1 family)
MSLKQRAIKAGFGLFRATGLHRLAGTALRGRGAILMFHRVRPADAESFAPNGLLEIAPAFFEAVLTRLRDSGLEIVALDEAMRRLRSGEGRPFAALTFDDGFRDIVQYGLPVLERHSAPFTCYIAPGLADRTARLWWMELATAIRRLSRIELELDGRRVTLPAGSDAEKSAAFARIGELLRAGREAELRAIVARLSDEAGVDGRALVEAHCLDWGELRALAAHELATLGAHSLSHRSLAQLPVEAARREIQRSRERIEQETGGPCRHFAYPYGDRSSASLREFALAKEQNFVSAVTTRPGMIFPAHAAHPMALPRLSVNGQWQDIGLFDVLLSGAPFALWNRGRRLNVE